MDFVKQFFGGIAAFLLRWQESIVWLPLLVVFAAIAWVIAGAVDRTATIDALSILLLLPIYTAYAIAALAVAWIGLRRWRRKLTKEEQKQLWLDLQAGKLGAITTYTIDAAVWTCTVIALLLFFLLLQVL